MVVAEIILNALDEDSESTFGLSVNNQIDGVSYQEELRREWD